MRAVVRVSMLVLLVATSLSAATVNEVIDGALAQVGKTRSYDSAYRQLQYPNGDVPLETGVCSDVVVRAFRRAGLDLQQLVHDDMRAHFASYPQLWGLRGPDANIDHRRVPNLATFFRRQGKSLAVTHRGEDYAPGDVVVWRLPGNGLAHIGLVSDRRATTDRYLVVHNIGYGTQVEDVLFAYEITGHFRWFR